jgi:rSAM/selenodomain-associated transferase 1
MTTYPPPIDPSRNGLIVFLRTPEAGKVKTRLAADIGNTGALRIYRKLVQHTLQVCSEANVGRYLFYDQHLPDPADRDPRFHYRLQHGNTLGERMYNAFNTVFDEGCTRSVIIGSDCAELTKAHISTAFDLLSANDSVLGPAKDGGYYLLGLNTLHPSIFSDKQWSTSTVLEHTIRDIDALGWSLATLEPLSDIDTLADVKSIRPDWLRETATE